MLWMQGGAMSTDDAEEDDNNGLLVAFTVDMMEWHDGPIDYLCHNIKGEVFLLEEHGERETVGYLAAEMFNTRELYWAGTLFDAYDSRSNQLTNAYERLYNFRTREFEAGPLRVVGGFDFMEPSWHLHISSLFIKRDMRGRRFGL